LPELEKMIFWCFGAEKRVIQRTWLKTESVRMGVKRWVRGPGLNHFYQDSP